MINKKAKKDVTSKENLKRNRHTSFSLLIFSLVLISLTTSFHSCKKTHIPRPYGYFRVDFPAHDYHTFDSASLAYRFDVSEWAKIIPVKSEDNNNFIDIKYPTLNANIHCSYKPVNNNLFELSEDTHSFVYAHTSRADGVPQELVFENPEKSVYGILYVLKGNVASPVQFVVTDSIHHFFRGSLYFENVPNKDSIAPMVEYVREDIIRLMESFEWKR